METLADMRKSIDNIDNAIIAMFAERFKVTDRVGHYKALNSLPARDSERESIQYDRINQLAVQYGLDPDFAKSYLSAIISRVIQNHEMIAANFGEL
ncbi:MAG: chorismate mutase [Halioglobus sp.]|nr:chorismate mutase [Halioglobus sp.]